MVTVSATTERGADAQLETRTFEDATTTADTAPQLSN